MKVEFKKIAKTPKEFEASYLDEGSSLIFKGSFLKKSSGLVKIEGSLSGTLSKACDICAEDVGLELYEEIKLYASQELYSGDDSIDVIEFEDSELDFDVLLQSEIESIRSDYFRCKNCIKGE
ncbi:MAG: hypothetical protein ACOC08_05135 [Campylobacterales bacterium]